MKPTSTAKMTMTALKMNSAGLKLPAITTPRKLPRQSPSRKYRPVNQNRIQWGGEFYSFSSVLRPKSDSLLYTILYTPFASPTGNTVATTGASNKPPTRKPAPGRTVVPTTYFPTYSPTITAKPSEFDPWLIL